MERVCVSERRDVSGLIEKNATRFTGNRSHIVHYIAAAAAVAAVSECVYNNIHSFIEGNPVSRSRRIGWGTRTTTKIRDEINQSDQRDSAYIRGGILCPHVDDVASSSAAGRLCILRST